jgi:phospholipid/cholesterol/gamma-HCH transport system substrate-binding protein
MRRKLDTEIKAGIFVTFGLVVFMITVLMMGGGKAMFDTFYRIKLEVADAAGLAKGATIRSGGLKIGRVEDISFTSNYTNVVITLLVDTSYQERIRQDSLVRFQTQGVLGDKYLEITGGSPDQPVIPDGGAIQAEMGKDLSSMLADGGNAVQLLKENLANLKVITGSMAEKNRMSNILKDLEVTTAALKDVTQSLKAANVGQELGATMKNLRAVSEKVKNGEGTIGALFSDASLYEDLKHLIGGANRNNVLKFFVRQAVKSSDDAAAKSAEEQKAKDAKPAPKK